NVYYDVGSANEALGRSGFAHLFEHLMFQESANMGKGDFDKWMDAAGTSNNGTTDQDRTLYFEIVPSNRINLALWMEADRMASLRVQDENFKREREVVKEERRMRIDNAPYSNGLIAMDTLTTNYQPYRHTVIGTMDDLNAATAADANAFYKQYYVPNNATITLAGDITLQQAKDYGNQYFAKIPRGKDIPPVPAASAAPRTDGERRVTFQDKLASVPLMAIGYTVPQHENADIYALQLLARALGGGESSRLNQAIVKDAKAALQASSGMTSHRQGGFLQIITLPTQGNDVTKLETLINEQVDKIKAQGITPEELAKVKRQYIATQIMQRQTVLSKAEAIQHARFMHGDPAVVNTDLAKYNAVTAEDIKRVANKYLTQANRTVVTVVPATKPAT
ncbi:MAG TPA: pitrilysin family protein, partial [Longimicrobiales bacterium]|nr:pitrilysin family protein [Longimicrobiales bacterium]